MTYLDYVLISSVNLLKNLSEFLSSLTLIDVIFFFSIILLMILVVVLLYFIKVNEDVIEKEEEIEVQKPLIEEVTQNDENDFTTYTDYDDEEGELIDLKSISEALESGEKNAELTRFEEEQEKDAIISYDELLKKTQENSVINYKNEVMFDDLLVKEVDLDNLAPSVINDGTIKSVSYAEEEAFLESLKKLEKQLN